MKLIVVDSRKFMEKTSAHAYLKEKIASPEYYGNNLDALFDVLTSIGEQTAIVILKHRTEGSSYAQQVIETMHDAVRENKELQVEEVLYP